MTIRVDSSLIPGKFHVGFRGLGVLGSTIPSSGSDGPGFGYPSVELDDANAELWFQILTYPSGTLAANEDTSFTYSGPTSSFTFRKWRNGVDEGTATVTLAVGVAASSALMLGTSQTQAVGSAVVSLSASAAGASDLQAPAHIVATASPLIAGSSASGPLALAIQTVLANCAGSATVYAVSSASTQVYADTVASIFGGSSVYANAVSVYESVAAVTGSSNVLAAGQSVVVAVAAVNGTGNAQASGVSVTNATSISVASSVVAAIASCVQSTFANISGAATVRGTSDNGVHYFASGERFNIKLTLTEYSVAVSPQQYIVKITS